jgi:exopolyphosphatase / guanosine-5'-triphosphate,3'-diphosphate pyrophosphatase
VVQNPRVAVIDIGSNSIKILVATRAADGSVAPLRVRTLDARISAGLGGAAPRLGEEGMQRGIDAVRTLLADAAEFAPAHVVLVATSAVRDAANGDEFRRRVHDATGHEIRILSGDEEANLIGRGLTCDPALRGLRDFYVFDLGGGSLECLAFRERRIDQAISLPLGCVRLTERFVPDLAVPFPAASAEAVQHHVRSSLVGSGFRFSLSPGSVAVGTGGTVSTVRAILGARRGVAFEQTDPLVTVAELRELLGWLGSLPLAARQQIPGLPPARADVFPAALATFIALAELGGFASFQNSLYNLRYGIAAQALE